MQSRNSSMAGVSVLRLGLIVTTMAVLMAHWPRSTAAVKPPAIVEINKCCRIGEQLAEDRRCLVGGTEKWWPLIYLPLKEKMFMPQGDAPRFMKVREQTIPACDHLEAVRTKVVLSSNGSLLLTERNQFVDPEQYCVDQDAALVCAPRPHDADALLAPAPLTKVKKCCGGRNLVYRDNNCVSLDGGHELFAKPIVANASAIDMVFGFPECTEHTIAGPFDERRLDIGDGSLTTNSGKLFLANEYCLEYTVDKVDESSVSVFVCAEHLAEPKITTATPSNQVRCAHNKFVVCRIMNLF